MWRTEFAADLSGVAVTRRLAGDHLQTTPVSEAQREDTVLLVSELVTNAVRHGTAPFELRIDASEQLIRIEVDDGSPCLPVALPREPLRAGGMGIRIVERLANRWGSHPTPLGKTVWCELQPPRASGEDGS